MGHLEKDKGEEQGKGQSATYLGDSVLRDLDIDSLVAVIPTYTKVGAAVLRDRLSDPTSNLDDLKRRQDQIKAIKTRCKVVSITALREQLRDTEADVTSVAAASSDSRHSEYYGQILWATNSRFAFLNRLNWLTEAIVFFRTIFLPGLSILLPIFVFVAPLIFYNLVLKEPLTFSGYIQMLQTSLKKAMPSMLGKQRFVGRGGVLEMGEQFVHIGVSVAMFVASIWNQVSAAIAMRSVVSDMRRRADAVLTFSKATCALAAALDVPLPADLVSWSSGQLGLFGDAWNSPDRVQALLEVAGELDMLAGIALTKRTCFPSIGADTIRIQDLYHPGLQRKNRIYNTVEMGSAERRRHVLLTGPNRGGKSTLLKSVGCAVLMAQTVGIVFGRSATLPIFDNIITALSPQDVIGKLSLFEAEIEFAKDVKQRLATTPGKTFLMMDEIFHGTNAHDGVEASQVFLDDLYKSNTSSGLYSIVSTHYMDLPERYGKELTQNLCMDASINVNDPDRLVYTYKVCDGVNRFSSVREILLERGLCVKRVKKTTEDASKA
jgi:energy-coupling factor transporter ATP-binding protein EcfA2